jgi:LacI family transcriptional regulator
MPTIHDIAKEAKVSTATVSRVFSNHPNVKDELRERVLHIAREHNYFPRLSNRRRTVILITPSRSEHPVQNYVEMVVSHIADACVQQGYRIEILLEDHLDRLANMQFCGAIHISSKAALWKNWSTQFDSPLVIIDRKLPRSGPGVFSIRSNEEQGMELSVDYLYQRGHRRIGCLLSNSPMGNTPLRVELLDVSLSRRGLPTGDQFIRQVDEVSYVEEVGKLLRQKVDAIIAPGGLGGLITAYALSLYQKRIPEDISLIVSERAMVSRYSIPPQTAITQDYQKLASVAVKAIDTTIRRDVFPRDTVLDYQLIERDSVMTRVPTSVGA